MLNELFEIAMKNLFILALHLDSGRYPRLLTKKEEAELAELSSKGDLNARDKLIEHNLRLVAYIINKHYSESRDIEDLISIGTIGLIRAAETFDPGRDISFSTYASTCIQNQVKMYFRKNKHRSNEVFLNDPIDTDKNGNELTMADIFSDNVSIDDEVDLKINMQKLYKYVNNLLDEREREVIIKRYGLSVDRKAVRPMTQREIADQMGISRSYISRIEKKALEKLKNEFCKKI